eukprot:1158632-Pelagomonas_calceolata.AAC.6
MAVEARLLQCMLLCNWVSLVEGLVAWQRAVLAENSQAGHGGLGDVRMCSPSLATWRGCKEDQGAGIS